MTVPYFQVPNDVFDQKLEIIDPKTKKKRILNPSERIIYIYLYRCSNQGSTAFPSYKTLAEKCGMSDRTAISAINTLTFNHFIERETRGYRSKSNVYHINELSQTTTSYCENISQLDELEEEVNCENISPNCENIAYINPKDYENIAYNKELPSYKELNIKNDNSEEDLIDFDDTTKESSVTITPPKKSIVTLSTKLPLKKDELISFSSFLEYTNRKINADNIEAVNYYLDKYKQATTNDHPDFNTGQWEHILDNILDYIDLNTCEIINISLLDIKKLIDNHFLSGKAFLIQDFVAADNMIKEMSANKAI